jgi:hypothetical protein
VVAGEHDPVGDRTAGSASTASSAGSTPWMSDSTAMSIRTSRTY